MKMKYNPENIPIYTFYSYPIYIHGHSIAEWNPTNCNIYERIYASHGVIIVMGIKIFKIYKNI